MSGHRHRTHVLDLPSDVFIAIFSYLPLGSLYALLLTCKHTGELVSFLNRSFKQNKLTLQRWRNSVGQYIFNPISESPIVFLSLRMYVMPCLVSATLLSLIITGLIWNLLPVPSLLLGMENFFQSSQSHAPGSLLQQEVVCTYIRSNVLLIHQILLL